MYSLSKYVNNESIQIKINESIYKGNEISIKDEIKDRKERMELIRESVAKIVLELAEKVKLSLIKKKISQEKKQQAINSVIIDYGKDNDIGCYRITIFGIPVGFVISRVCKKTGKTIVVSGIGDPKIVYENAIIDSIIKKVNEATKIKKNIAKQEKSNKMEI